MLKARMLPLCAVVFWPKTYKLFWFITKEIFKNELYWQWNSYGCFLLQKLLISVYISMLFILGIEYISHSTVKMEICSHKTIMRDATFLNKWNFAIKIWHTNLIICIKWIRDILLRLKIEKKAIITGRV